MLTRRSLLLAAPALGAAALLARPARAAEPEIFAVDGLAIRGIDPIGYHEEAGIVPGSAAAMLVWKGAEWRFASADRRDTFMADPGRWAPAFGGYCAFAASRGYLAPTIPEAWTVHDGRLYLNATLRARELWLQDIPGNIARGEANWPGILG